MPWTTLALCTGVKLLAALEWPPLYRFFLGAPARMIALFTGTDFREHDGTYLFPQCLLDYSCSGIHFFILLCLAGAACRSTVKLWQRFLLAYATTLMANTARIALALRLQMPDRHEALGTAVFLSFLFVYYEIIRRESQPER